MKISVCLAAYNGEKYIKEQLYSILPELSVNDEIILVDDHSSDDTLELVKNIDDKRIQIYENITNIGVNANFEKAISLSKGDVIFMADQDDVWIQGRVKIMIDALYQNNALLVSSNFDCFDNSGKRRMKYESKIESKKSKKYIENIFDIFIGKPNYYGCAMAFKKELIPIILPVPDYVESHDLWIAIVANLMKSNVHINDLTLHRRIHGGNLSIISRKIVPKLKSRWIFLKSIFSILKRTRLNPKRYHK